MPPSDSSPLPLDIVLNAYARGYFPMADHAGDRTLKWYNPPLRAILPIPGIHVPRSLQKTVLKGLFEVRINTAFDDVLQGCASQTQERPHTWINPEIAEIFSKLHQAGYAHSVECWREGKLAGGLYGLALNGAFCGESMFSRTPDASKTALVHLCARLDTGGFTLLDTQILNPHMEQFGAYEIPRAEYLKYLESALLQPGDFSLATNQPVDELSLVAKFLEKTASN